MTATTELVTVDAAIIAGALEVCYAAAAAPLPENPDVTDALAVLAGAIRLYHRISSGALAPADAFWQLEERAEWQALPEALMLAAQDAWDDARELAYVIAVIHGAQMAALVSGQDKGESWH